MSRHGDSPLHASLLASWQGPHLVHQPNPKEKLLTFFRRQHGKVSSSS